MMFYKQWLKMETHVGSNLDNPVAVFSLNNTFDFKWLTASLVTMVQTEGNMGNKYVNKGYFCTDLSLYKSLLKNRLTLSLNVSTFSAQAISIAHFIQEHNGLCSTRDIRLAVLRLAFATASTLQIVNTRAQEQDKVRKIECSNPLSLSLP